MSSAVLTVFILVLPILACAVGVLNEFRRRSWWMLFAITCTLVYGTLLWEVEIRRSELNADVDRYDLNHDGFVNGAEDTPAAREAIARAINDTGMSLAPITGVPMTLLWVGFCFGAQTIFSRVVCQRRIRLLAT